MKPTVYIETSVISYLTDRPSRDLVAAARQAVTCAWWEQEATDYSLFIADAVREEASEGDPEAAERRRAAIAAIPVLDVTAKAATLANQLAGGIPQEAVAGALHVAVAALADMDYLLTWNYKYLANAPIRRKLESLVEDAGLSCPVICTPQNLKASTSATDDPIIAELHRTREEYAKRFNYDISAMADHIRGRQKEHPERVVSFPPKRPRQRSAAPETWEGMMSRSIGIACSEVFRVSAP